MTRDLTETTVRKTVTVPISADRAFSLFTDGMMTWWPEEHHIGGVPAAMVIEKRPGGRIYDRRADGSEQDWGKVMAFEPPARFTFAWHLGGDWAYDPDPAHASTVDVRFIAETPSSTRVELEHRDFAKHVGGGDQIREAVGSPGGWSLGLSAYARAALAD